MRCQLQLYGGMRGDRAPLLSGGTKLRKFATLASCRAPVSLAHVSRPSPLCLSALGCDGGARVVTRPFPEGGGACPAASARALALDTRAAAIVHHGGGDGGGRGGGGDGGGGGGEGGRGEGGGGGGSGFASEEDDTESVPPAPASPRTPGSPMVVDSHATPLRAQA